MICLYVCALLVPVSCMGLSLAMNCAENPLNMQDDITTAQLRHALNLADDFQVSPEMMTFTLNQQECSLSLINGNLVMKPGTRIYYMNLDDVQFALDGERILLTYERNEEETTREIAHE